MIDLETDPVAAALIERLRSAHGAARVCHLVTSRTDRRRLSMLVASGILRQTADVIHFPDTEHVVVLARRCRGVLCCSTGAAYLGLPVPSWVRTRTHLLVAHRQPAKAALHISRRKLPGPWEPPLLPLPALFAQYLRCADDPVLPLAALDAALRENLVLASDIEAELYRVPGADRARQRLHLASPRARSPLETQARIDLARAQLPFRDGVVVPGVGEVDFLVADRVVVETDGYAYHQDELQFGRDRSRDRILSQRGMTVLRFTRSDVLGHKVVPDVRAVLEVGR